MARGILLNVYVATCYILSNDWRYIQDIGGALKPEQIVGKDGPISGLAMRVLFTGGSLGVYHRNPGHAETIEEL